MSQLLYALEDYGLRPQRIEVIDSSMLNDYVNCPSYFYLRHILGQLKKIFNPDRQAPLDWGTVWHRVMEVYSKTRDSTAALVQLEPWPSTVMAETDKHGRSKARMAEIFFDYVEQFGEADALEFDILREEQYFDVYDEEVGLRWCGRIDGIRRRKRNRKVVVWDHKGTSKMGADYFDQYEHSFQLPGYVWAAQHMLTDPIDQLMLDVVYTLKGSHDFFRRTMPYGPERLAEWVGQVKIWVKEIHFMQDNYLEQPEMWKKSYTECTRYGRCQFADVHFAPPTRDTRLRILQRDYHEHRWDPSRGEMEG